MVVKEKKQYEFYDQLQFPLPEKRQQIHCNDVTKDISTQIDELLKCPEFTDNSSNCITSGKVIGSNSLSSRCQEDEKTSIGGCKIQNMYISRFMTAPCNKTVNMATKQ